jgi:Acyltransferase family
MASSIHSPAPASPELSAGAPAHAAHRRYNVAIGYLRGFLVILVLAHHSALAYFDGAPAAPASLLATPMLWRAFPIVDPRAHSKVINLFVAFNDNFFMALMFFVSGLFVWSSLRRKGDPAFIRDRLKRLGIPFVFTAAIVVPLAYYPSYLMTRAHGVGGYVHDWLSLGDWPTGPAWFIWVLLAFDLAAGTIFAFAPNFGDALGRVASNAREHPVRFFTILVAASMAAYVPMAAVFGSFAWTSVGPFQFQTARLLHYLVYFCAGIGVGAYGIDRGLLAPDGRLARHWGRWAALMLLVYTTSVLLFVTMQAKPAPMSPVAGDLLGGFIFALGCGAMSFAFLAIFIRFISRPNAVFDSLSQNEYGMYVIHYMFVSWLQMALLAIALGPIEKATLVFAGVLLLSWGTSAALRRIPAVGRIV